MEKRGKTGQSTGEEQGEKAENRAEQGSRMGGRGGNRAREASRSHGLPGRASSSRQGSAQAVRPGSRGCGSIGAGSGTRGFTARPRARLGGWV